MDEDLLVTFADDGTYTPIFTRADSDSANSDPGSSAPTDAGADPSSAEGAQHL